jgi:putative hydrolase of the HAD superfamily
VLDDVTAPDACFAALFEHFAQPHAWALEPDAAAVLPELTQRGFVLGMASNYDRRLRNVVAGLAPLGPVRHLVISSEVGWRKPAPAFFAALCRGVGLGPEQIMLVGDDVENDYEGASAAGLKAVLFDPRGRRRDLVRVERLGELL